MNAKLNIPRNIIPPLKRLIQGLSTILLLLPAFFTHAQANLVLNPAISSVNIGDDFSITLEVQAGTQEVDGIEAYLDFNPSFVTVNSVVYNAGSQLPTVIINNFNQSLGQINAASGLFGGGFVTGTFDYITINLTATAAGSTSIDFSFAPINRKTEISRSGSSVLGTTADATITVIDPNANTSPVITVGGPANKVVAEGASLQVPISIADLDGNNLTVTISSVSNEPQLLQSANTGAQVDPFPTTAAGFLSVSNVTNGPGAYSANLNFAPVFGDGGGADGDGDGVYTVTVAVSDGVNNISTPITVTVTDVPQPLSTTTATRIQAESFDNQGPANTTGSGNNGIGVEVNNPGVTNIGFTHTGEFAEYLIDVPQAGTYDFSFQVAKASGAAAIMTINGGPASITVAPTGDWQAYVTATASVDLPAGTQTLRLDWSSGSGFLFNIDYFDIDFAGTPGNTAPVVAISSPTTGSTVARGTTITLTGTATDAEDGDLSASLDWTSTDIQFSTVPSSGMGASITGQLVTPGNQTITANVMDSGSLSGSDAVTVTVSGPQVNIAAPAENATEATTDVQLQWTATDVLYGLTEHFHIYVNPPDINNIDINTRISTASAIGQTFWDLTALDGIVTGANTIVIRVANQFHEEFTNPEAQDIVNFTVDVPNFELPGPCDNTLFRVNVGGPTTAAADASPVSWSADQDNFPSAGNSPYLVANSGGGSTYDGNSGSAYPGPIILTDPSVPASASADIFNTERYDATGTPEMKWGFPVAPGTEVQVTLLFAELFGQITQPGQRVFDVAIEGTVLPAFANIDPFAIAGPKGAFTRSATITVTDGTLDIELLHGVENPALKGIQICGLSSVADNTPPVITLLGDNPLNLTVGDTYTDPGAIATDDIDGDITANIVVAGDVVNTGSPGTYVITYNVSDAAGNPATEVARTVIVSLPDAACAYVAINPSGDDLATGSTFTDGFIITNNSQGLNITSVSFDLSTAIYPNIVFDPVGTAGDNTAKCFTLVSQSGGDGSVGLSIPGNGGTGADPDCVAPFIGQTVVGNGGYSALSIDFSDFEPGESINFAIDVDPLSIQGFPGAGNAGAISGLELIGSTVTVQFSNGQSATGELYRVQPGSNDGSENYLYPGSECAAPTLAVLGAASSSTDPGFMDATVGGINQVAQISGTPGDAVTLLVIESTIEDVGPGITPGPYEANKAQVIQELDAVIGGGGTVDIPVVLADNASGDIYYLVAVKIRPDDGLCGIGTCNTSDVWRLKVVPVFGDPNVLIEITPGAGLAGTTYGGSGSFQITNQSTGNLQITGVSFDLSTGILPDMVFDPTGSGGDATAQCFTAGGTAAAVGLVAPANACVSPFSGAHNGGFDILSTTFTDFNPGETFTFGVDVDPNSIQGVAGAGNAGAVSGYELMGATLTVSFNDGSVIVSSLYEDGSLGGSQAVVAQGAPATPSIAVVDVPSTPATVGDLNQIVTVSGTPGDHVSLLVMDSRLYIASGDPPFNVSDPTYYANEAMSGKTLYTGIIGGGGTVDIPIMLLVTSSGNATPNGGLNQIIAVTSAAPYAVDQPVSATSNTVTLLYDPNVLPSDITINVTRQGMANHDGDYTVKLYQVGAGTPDYDLIGTANAAGMMSIAGIAPGTYELAVKYSNCLQIVETIVVTGTGDMFNVRQLRTGDVNNNNEVNILDFSTMVNSFNLQAGDIGYNSEANLNGVGKVDILDFSLMVSNFNTLGEVPSGVNN